MSVVWNAIGIILSGLLLCSAGFAETKRATEEMLSKPVPQLKKENPPVEQISQPKESGGASKQPKKQDVSDDRAVQAESERPQPAKNETDKSSKTDKEQKNAGNGMQIKLQGCHYDQNAQSVACAFHLTSPSDAFKIALYCYSGIQAVDSNNKTLQCNEVEMGQNRSWEYVVATLDKGAQVKVEVNLQAASPVTSISKMQMLMSVNGKRQMVQLTNIAVQ